MEFVLAFQQLDSNPKSTLKQIASCPLYTEFTSLQHRVNKKVSVNYVSIGFARCFYGIY